MALGRQRTYLLKNPYSPPSRQKNGKLLLKLQVALGEDSDDYFIPKAVKIFADASKKPY